MHDSVTVHIEAPIDRVWDLVSDITRIGEFSPETFEAEWLGDAKAAEVGARFRGHVKRNERGPVYWTVCEVTAAEPEREFAFTVLANGRRVNNWRYELAPSGNGTDVTESFQLEDNAALRLYWRLLGRLRGRRNRNDMQTTLERMKAVLEAEG